jgi:predicted HTH domain antitoxin
MPVTITIPDSVAHALKIPESRLQSSLSEELAVVLYADGLLSFGKARQLAGYSKREFAQLLGRSQVSRHYAEEELKDDLRHAGCK